MMNILQTSFITLGVLMFILAVLEFLHIKSKLLIYKRIIEYLDESERIKYQKAIAIPTAIIGIIWLISGVFFWNQEYIFKIGLYGGWCIWFVWMLVVNKKHLGYLFPLNVPKKIF